jgi:protease-4
MMYPPAGGPPPMFGPPMPMPMMPPPGMFRPQKSFARIIFTTLASIIFGISITLNIYLLALGGIGSSLGLSSRAGIIQSVEVQGDPKEKIALVPVAEAIWEPTARKFDAMMTAIEADANVKAIVLSVETPGGTVTASDEIHERIKRFKRKMESSGRKVPVVVSMGGIAASGGYYISCAGDYIYAQRTTLTGSIGVVFPFMNFHKLAEKYGVEDVSIASPPNGLKTAGSSLSPLSEQEKKYFQGLSDDFYGTFVTVVKDGRKSKLTKPVEQIADGRVYTANEALALGLVDQIGYPTDAYDKAASMAGLSNKHVVRYTPKPPSIFEMFGAETKAGGVATGGGTVNINGINVNIDVRALLDEMGRPRPLYLWRGQ